METNVILQGDCLSRLKELPDESIDAIITDPPYGLEFMGKEWDKFTGSDTGIMATPTSILADKGFDKLPIFRGMNKVQINNFHKFTFEWATECLRVLKHGGFLLAFGGSRTYHRLASGIEDSGFEIRDQIMWIYGSGFPKSLNIGKAIDKMQNNERQNIGVEVTPYKVNGNAREGVSLMCSINADFCKETNSEGYRINNLTKGFSEWEGWGTALKPAHEPIVVARKPLSEKTVALNVLKYGTGGINIDACRVARGTEHMRGAVGCKITESDWKNNSGLGKEFIATDSPLGRFPANIILECTCVDLKESKIKNNGGIPITKVRQSGITNMSGTQLSDDYIHPIYFDKNGFEDVLIHTNPDCPCFIMDSQSGNSLSKGGQSYSKKSDIYGKYSNDRTIKDCGFNDNGGASRFFYCAKASKSEREFGLNNLSPSEENLQGLDTRGRTLEREDGSKTLVERWQPDAKRVNNHPTVKPLKLMEYLIKLVTKENAVVLDPFLGSGTTAIGCLKLNRRFIGIEKNKEYIDIANARIKPYLSQTKLPNLSDVGVVKHE